MGRLLSLQTCSGRIGGPNPHRVSQINKSNSVANVGVNTNFEIIKQHVVEIHASG